MKTPIAAALLVTFIGSSWSKCTFSHMIICESLSEFQADSRALQDAAWSEVLIKSTKKVHKVLFDFGPFANVYSLTVVGQINDIQGYALYNHVLQNKILNFYDNEIKVLRRDAFRHPCKLERLYLAKNGIKTVESGTFARFQSKLIDLSDNELESIESYTFYFSDIIESVIIRRNKLTRIGYYSFSPNIKMINLEENKLRNLENIFNELTNLEILILRRNEVDNLPDLSNVTTLRLLDVSYNRISRISTTTFDKNMKMELLDLSHNRIVEIDTFTFFAFQKLVLDLSHNKIKDINFVRSSLVGKKWRIISLAFNHLRNLDFGNWTSKEIHTPMFLILHGNPWHCDTWLNTELYLEEIHLKQDKCDLNFFRYGLAPYCCYADVHVDYFHGVVGNTFYVKECELTMKQYYHSKFIHVYRTLNHS